MIFFSIFIDFGLLSKKARKKYIFNISFNWIFHDVFCFYYQSFEFFEVFKANVNQKKYEENIFDPHDGFLKFPLSGLFKENKKSFKGQK